MRRAPPAPPPRERPLLRHWLWALALFAVLTAVVPVLAKIA